MLDFLVGLDTEFSDMVDGSHLYFPSAVQLEDVVLPQDQKKLIVETVENFAAYKKVRKTLGLDKTGMCRLCFYQTLLYLKCTNVGPSCQGKPKKHDNCCFLNVEALCSSLQLVVWVVSCSCGANGVSKTTMA